MTTLYQANHKIWDRIGRLTPDTGHSESHRPHFRSEVAPWLPVQRENKTIEHYVVISKGKVVSLDRKGCLVPAGLRKAWNKSSGSTILSYTADDVSDGYVINLVTGEFVDSAVSYTEGEVTVALQDRGLITASERAMDFISHPVGFLEGDGFRKAGTDILNPTTYFQHNWKPQSTVAITCDYVARLPLVPAAVSTETMDGALVNESDSLDWSAARTGGWFGSTALEAIDDLGVSAGDDVVGYVTAKYPLARVTTETPISDSEDGLVKEVGSPDLLSAAGEYYIDHERGIIMMYEEGGNAIPSPFDTSSTLDYYHYEDALDVDDSRTTTYAFATGDVKPGMFLTYDENSNLIPASLDLAAAKGYDSSGDVYSADPDYDTDSDAAISLQLEQGISNHVFDVVAQCLELKIHPQDYLDRVKTPIQGQSSARYRVAGSATGGRPENLTYTNAGATEVIVNLILR